MEASLGDDKAYQEGKDTHKGYFPHHLFFQNFTLIPLPPTKGTILLRISHPFLIAFQTPNPILISHEARMSIPLFLHILPCCGLFPNNILFRSEPPAPLNKEGLIKRYKTSNG